VWLSRRPIPGSAEAIERLRGAGRAVVFVTNDPRSTRAELAEQLVGIGVAADPDDVLTSALATAEAIAKARPAARVLAVGTSSLGAELADRGLALVPIEDGARADAVVVGGGARFDQDVLRIASSAARDGAELWATNRDPTYPTADGLVPGTGALVAALEVASGVPARNVGKPEPTLFEAALRRLDCERALMAGDSLHSDIAGAARAGMATALILTGRDSHTDIDTAPHPPDHIFKDLSALAAELT
jgi:glycerol 3-phosphatase-2